MKIHTGKAGKVNPPRPDVRNPHDVITESAKSAIVYNTITSSVRTSIMTARAAALYTMPPTSTSGHKTIYISKTKQDINKITPDLDYTV
jgi:hypothetical protein